MLHPIKVVRSTIVAIALFVVPLVAQEPLAFDVVSVKRTPPGATGGGFQNSAGQFVTVNYSIRSLLVLAYGGAGYQIGDLPKWTEAERYDINAKMPPGTFTPQQRSLMIRSMLAERFQLKTHRETRDLPIYAMVLARNDRKPGPALHSGTLDCADVRAKRAGRGPTSPAEMEQCNFLYGALPNGARRVRAQSVPLRDLASGLGQYVDHPIFDRTDLPGNFDVDLTFVPMAGGPPAGEPGDAPFIFNALQEQLGLKLELTKAPVNMLIIDNIDHPTEN